MSRHVTNPAGVLVGLMISASVVFAEQTDVNLGRVFLTPEERLQLDKNRLDYYTKTEEQSAMPIMPVEEVGAAEISMEQVPPTMPPLIVNGFVRRHGTSGTVWINGESTYDGDLAISNVDHLKTKIVGERVKLAPLNAGDSVYLKPGQVYEPEEKAVFDSYTVHEIPSIGTD